MLPRLEPEVGIKLPYPTYANALALAREELWAQESFSGSPADTETVRVPKALVERLTDTVHYAA
jgi:hypothetical protein